MGELFGLSQPAVNSGSTGCCPSYERLSMIWVSSQSGTPMVLPEVKPPTPNGASLIIDGTERRRQRPKDPEKQAPHYSGKKKAHSDKNVVVVDLLWRWHRFLEPDLCRQDP